MIAQARIDSDRSATVHLADEEIGIHGEHISEVRANVKSVFIDAARRAGRDLDVVIVEPDATHHLRVEPSGRISTREADDRPLFGPSAGGAGHGAGSVTAPSSTAPSAAHSFSASSFDVASFGQHAFDPEGDVEATAVHPAVPEGSTADSPSWIPPSLLGEETHEAHEAQDEQNAQDAQDAQDEVVSGSVPSAAPTTTSASGASAARTSASSAEQAPSAPVAPAPAPSAASPAEPADQTGPAARPGHGRRAAATAAPQAPASAPAADAPQVADAQPSGETRRPTLQDLQSAGRQPSPAPATRGWQGTLTRLTGGRISPRPGRAEREERAQLQRISRTLDGPKNIAVVNLKGGAHKTTASLMIAATLGMARGGGVLAWDNNETRGTLGWRGAPAEHHRTAIDLLRDLDQLRTEQATVSDLDRYVRRQEATRFDILASDEDPGSSALIDDAAFRELDETLSRFYRLKVIDTGNNVRASNWLAGVQSADQLVIISTLREDTFNAAAWMIDELRATGLAEQVDHAVTILSHSSGKKMDPSLRTQLHKHFGAHTRAIVEVPFEEQFVDGAPLDFSRIHPETRAAWLRATAEIVDGL
ncbi:chromosome partitioning protein [Brachybacterium halotolerans subsp. kimchii]|uniref:chromosome partitioning protein n=1 Tax=Brachybacterium halotolerans TaxID=2795215 RepID=UPI001E405706|nr:chromosome partitioning protein [Brachybacterium halotolerans]UEJ81073.1 chromosome partitioning protein [Brachybacterium halotolerans subsp. kimchii]